MARRIEFFLGPTDVVSMLARVESTSPLFYVQVGAYTAPICPTYQSSSELPSLGRTSRPDRLSSPRYLVFPSRVEVVYRAVEQSSGAVLHMVDPWLHPPCLLITFGGRHLEMCVISGQIESGTKDKSILRLLKLFAASLDAFCDRVSRGEHETYVGPEAQELYRAGWRLTDSINAPVSLDCTI